MTDYDAFARFYDLDCEGVVADLPFWVSLARRTGGPILELAAGTGRVLVPLARAGFTIVGVDISPRMLEVAREKVAAAKLTRRVELIEADAREIELGRRFSFAFVALNSFGHFTEAGDAERVLERAREHLEPGGILAVDLPNPGPGVFGETGGALLHEYTRPGPQVGWQTMKLRSQWADHLAQRVDVSCVYDEVSPAGEVRRSLASFSLRYFYPSEFRLLLERTGFTVEAFYGSYELDPLEEESDRMIVVARAPGGAGGLTDVWTTPR